ncbi:MAG: hypothetical protein Q4G21_07535 [Dermabacter sp.]|nr:hypothetical protein [Dermabacter sp.]
MAKRSGYNVKGDKNELRITSLLLEHGFAINGLTTSDTGWDLHCHIPERLLTKASKAGNLSWTLSGKTAHVQVKSGDSGKLRVGTVRGWLTGSASGVPTILFGRLDNQVVFSTPDAFSTWLSAAEIKFKDSKDCTYKYDPTSLRNLPNYEYRKKRFPSVVHLWTQFPGLALAFPDLTGWVNGDEAPTPVLESIINKLAAGVLATEGTDRSSDISRIREPLLELYEAAKFSDPEGHVNNYMGSTDILDHTHGDGKFSLTSIDPALLPFLKSSSKSTATEMLSQLVKLKETDATPVTK